MYKIPTPRGSFADLKSEGYDVRIVYSIYDAYKLAKENPDKTVVHFSPGFETTTAPAGMLNSVVGEGLENFKIYSVHRLTPPAVETLVKQGTKFHGLIDPGHVSMIIGVKGLEYITTKYGIPQVIAGFEPVDMLLAILLLLKMVKAGEARIINEYTRAVRYESNVTAQRLVDKFFEVKDARWRALGVMPKSGLKLKNRAHVIFEAGEPNRAKALLAKTCSLEAEEASKAIEKVKDRRLLDLPEFLGEAEM